MASSSFFPSSFSIQPLLGAKRKDTTKNQPEDPLKQQQQQQHGRSCPHAGRWLILAVLVCHGWAMSFWVTINTTTITTTSRDDPQQRQQHKQQQQERSILPNASLIGRQGPPQQGEPRMDVQPKRGEPKQEQQPPQPLVQSNNVTKKEERVTIQQSTNSSSSRATTTLFSTGESTLHPWLNRTLTMVVRMNSGLNNQLLFMAQARQIQQTLQAALPGLSIRLVGLKTNLVHVIQQCFPGLRTMDFSNFLQDRKHFWPIRDAQRKWLSGRKNGVQLHNVNHPSQIQLLRDLLKEQYKVQQELQRGIQNNNATHVARVPFLPSSFPDNPYSIPYLEVSDFIPLSSILQDADLYYDLRHWLRIDPSCCAQLPYADETVFHFRNFLTEFEGRKPQGERQERLRLNFRELTPDDTAHYLFGPPPTLSQPMSNKDNNSKHKNNKNHSASTRMAIISRYARTATPYVQALKDQGWEVRLIQNHSGIQDFCFAMSTKATFVGVAHSTFAQMAGLLGNASTVRWYYLNYTMGDQGQSSTSFHYTNKDHNHSTLSTLGLLEQKRTFFPLYPSVQDSPRREFRQELFRPSGFMTVESLKQKSNALLASNPEK